MKKRPISRIGAGILSMILILSMIPSNALAANNDGDSLQTLICDLEEHTHSEECYEQKEALICGLEESEGHTHSADCYNDQNELICGQEETEGHTHSEDCYETQSVLTCEKEEHTHTDDCYAPEEESSDFSETEKTEITDADTTAENSDTEDFAAALATAPEQQSKQETVKSGSSGSVPDLLSGDNAYVRKLAFVADESTDSGYAISTGTGPWDDDDTAGNDSRAANNIVRSFDSVTYNIEFETALNADAVSSGISGYKEGTVYFEFVLPQTSDKAFFDTESMGWLSAFQEVVYETATEEIDGTSCQVLRGSFLSTPNSDNPSAIGSSYNTLTVAVRVLGMKNGEILQPRFTMWLKDNDVNTTYTGNNGGISQTVVTDSGYSCEAHGVQEYQTLIAPEVTVSSAPRYNIEIAKSSSDNDRPVGTYDFANTGNENAQNKNAGSVYGRLLPYGITFQILGKSDSDGLKGTEIPDGSDITFDMDISSLYVLSTDTSTAYDSTTDGSSYAPLFWSGDGSDSRQASSYDDRVDGTGTGNMASHGYALTGRTPYNKGAGANYCSNGGTWSFTVDADDPTKVHVTISGYSVDLSALPYRAAGDSSGYRFYNPDTVGDNYWRIQTAMISAGEFWVVQRYKDSDGTSISQKYGAGTFKTTVQDSGLSIGDQSYEQVKSDDDLAMLDVYLANAGKRNSYVRYAKYGGRWEDALTDGAASDQSDWIVSGGKLGIAAHADSAGAEGGNAAVGSDIVIKFDDAFFVPDGTFGNGYVKQNTTRTGTYSDNIKIIWGAKEDKTGWDHKGLMPDQAGYDEEMLVTTTESLVWFDSLDDLKNAGYTCVAVAGETRGLRASSRGQYQTTMVVNGTVKEGCSTGYVYMATAEGHIWTVNQVADAKGVDFGELTDDEITDYAKSSILSRTENSDKFIDPYWSKDDVTEKGQYSNKEKASYPGGTYKSGTGTTNYIDSCLLVPYEVRITKNVAQTTDTGDDKKVYDMAQSQRIVDYVLDPYINRGEGDGTSTSDTFTTTVTITDTLPASISYIPGSSYWDKYGTAVYTQGDRQQRQGTVENAEQIELKSVTKNADGTTTLVWELQDVAAAVNGTTHLGLIYFSCSIGTPGNEETDVVNQQQIDNTVTIKTSDVYEIEPSLTNGMKAQASIEVLKLSACSLSKSADYQYVEAKEDMGFVLNLGNNSNTPMSDVILVDSFPYNGDASGSHFEGPLNLTEVTAVDPSSNVYSNFRYFYTTDQSLRDKKSADYTNDGYTAAKFEDSDSWKELTLASDISGGLFANLPSAADQKDNEIVALVAVGTLPANTTLKIHLSLNLPDAVGGEYIVNGLSQGDLESYDRTSVVRRKLSGTTWIDADKNGKRDSSEKLLPGVTVRVVKKSDYDTLKNNALTAVNVKKESMSMQTGADGTYLFDYLPAGDFVVLFESTDGTVDLSEYTASPTKAAGVDETVNSDYTPVAGSDGALQYGVIDAVEMPAAVDITSSPYWVKNQDGGFYSEGSLTVSKKVTGNACDKDKAFSFTVTLSDKTINTTGDKTYGDMQFTNGEAKFTLKDGSAMSAAGLPGGITYTVTEDDYAGDGYVAEVDGKTTREITGKIVGNHTVTVAFTNIRNAEGSLTVSKTLAGNDTDSSKEFEFTITLDDDSINKTFSGVTFKDGVAALTLKGGERKVIEGLPNGTGYTVAEKDYSSEGYVVTASGDTSGKIDEKTPMVAAFTNTRNTYGSLSVSKKVAGNAGNKNKEFSFTVTLGDTTINTTDDTTYGEMEFKDGVATFTLKHGETMTAMNLPNGVTYTVTEKSYSADGYKTTKTGDTGKIAGNKTAEAVFTNTKNESTPSGDEDQPHDDEPENPVKTVQKAVEGVIQNVTALFQPAAEVEGETRDIPQTGDSSNTGLWIVLMVIAALGIGGIAVIRRKKNH